MPEPISDSDIEAAQRLLKWAPEQRKRSSDKPERTLTDVAQELGVSTQAIAKTEKRALRKCRIWCEKRGLDLKRLLGGL